MWSIPLKNVKWHSDPWPTVTSQPIRLSTNFTTFIPSLTFINYEWFPRSICNGCGMPAGNAYHSGHLVLSPTCLCSNCWDQIPRTCHVFTRLFTSNTPWYFLDFAYYRKLNYTKSIFSTKLFCWCRGFSVGVGAFDISVGVGAFVIGLGQISSFLPIDYVLEYE